MDVAIGDLVITDDAVRWRIHSINRDGPRWFFVARHLASPAVLAGDVATLTWSEADGAWRLGRAGTDA